MRDRAAERGRLLRDGAGRAEEREGDPAAESEQRSVQWLLEERLFRVRS